MQAILKMLLARAKERSTWLGLVSIVTAFGITLSPEQTAAIAAAGVTIAGLIAAFTPDKTD